MQVKKTGLFLLNVTRTEESKMDLFGHNNSTVFGADQRELFTRRTSNQLWSNAGEMFWIVVAQVLRGLYSLIQLWILHHIKQSLKINLQPSVFEGYKPNRKWTSRLGNYPKLAGSMAQKDEMDGYERSKPGFESHSNAARGLDAASNTCKETFKHLATEDRSKFSASQYKAVGQLCKTRTYFWYMQQYYHLRPRVISFSWGMLHLLISLLNYWLIKILASHKNTTYHCRAQRRSSCLLQYCMFLI